MSAPSNLNHTWRKQKDPSPDTSLRSPTPSTATVGSPVSTSRTPVNPSNPLNRAFRALNLNETATSIETPPSSASDCTYSPYDSPSSECSERSILTVVGQAPFTNYSILGSSTPRQNMSTNRQPSYWACTPVYVVQGQEWHDFGPVHKMVPGATLPMSVNEKPAATKDNIALAPADVATAPRAQSTILTVMDVSAPATDVGVPTTTDTIAQSGSDITMKSGDTTIKYAPKDAGVEGGSNGGMQVDVTQDKNDGENQAGVEHGDGSKDGSAIFGPVEIQQYAKSCHPFKEGEKTLGLPHTVYEAWNATAYDQQWMKNAGITDKAILKAFISKLKMDQLMAKGALPVGSELYIETKATDEAGNETVVEKMARVVAFESGTAYNTKAQKEYKKRLPDFDIFVDGVKKSEYKRCDGPKDLLKALHDLEPKPAATKGKNVDVGAWKSLHVRDQAGTELGSLYDVRQAYHRWEIEMDAWSTVTGTHTRSRRPSPTTGR
ncbi:MAG: hypothetical protein Q9207_002945 [Kuettlingeria erythrocarpa]